MVTHVAPLLVKMNWILRCDWLPGQARWHFLAWLGLPTIPQENKDILFLYCNNKSFIDQACPAKMPEYRPSSFLVCSRISTPSWSINAQKNLANIQPSWPHAWSISQYINACNIIFEAGMHTYKYCAWTAANEKSEDRILLLKKPYHHG